MRQRAWRCACGMTSDEMVPSSRMIPIVELEMRYATALPSGAQRVSPTSAPPAADAIVHRRPPSRSLAQSSRDPLAAWRRYAMR